MKIFLIDPGLINNVGHHSDVDFKIVRALVDKNHEVTVFSNEKITADLFSKFEKYAKVIPFHKSFPYANMEYFGEHFHHRVQSHVIESELKRIPTADLYLFPSLFLDQFNALSSLSKSQKIIAAMHLPPSWPKESVKNIWSSAFAKTNRNKENLILGIFEQELLIEYEALLSKPSLPITIFPIPFEGIKAISPRKLMNSVAILGHQRSSKSMHLGDLIKGLTELDFNVNFNDSSEKIKITNNMVDKVKSYGYVEDLGEIIAQSDAVILPYDKNFYRFNGSGIAWQSISSGVPLVAPAGTSISKMLSIYNNGVLFYDNSSKSILNAVVEMRSNFNSISNYSYEAMIKWRVINSLDKFIEIIENFKNKI